MVIPGSFAVLLLGLLAVWAQDRPLAGPGNGWVLVSLLLYVPLFALVPLVSAACAVNTASRTRMLIWANTMLRVRPSWRPWSSRYSDPLIHAIQIRAKTTANSASPRTMTCSARWWAAWPMTAT